MKVVKLTHRTDDSIEIIDSNAYGQYVLNKELLYLKKQSGYVDCLQYFE